MLRIRSNAFICAFALMAVVLGPRNLPADSPESTVGRVTRYDIATRDDLLFDYLIQDLMVGDVASLPILSNLAKSVGDWINQFVDANRIAGIITEAMPIDGQESLKSVDDLVVECAQTLGLPKPLVHVRNHHVRNAYISSINGKFHFVLTSSLLDLYEDRPQELKFIIGHELGHALLGHESTKRKAFGILWAIQTIEPAAVPDKFQNVLPPLALGRLFTWSREAEISADRAGLLCCGDPEVAYQAMMRLLHGLNPNSPWIDPTHPEFNVGEVIRSFQEWQNQPLVRFILYLKRQQLTHPYIPERLAALKVWADTGAYRSILDRPKTSPQRQLVEIVSIEAFDLAPEGGTVYPYVVVRDGKQYVLRTHYARKGRAAWWGDFPRGHKSIQQPRQLSDGQPLFFEIWDSGYVYDGFVGGFAVYPYRRDATKEEQSDGYVAEYTARILWDWKEAQTITRPGYAVVRVRFLDDTLAPAVDGGAALQTR